jgi:predicted metal-dependent peptidase
MSQISVTIATELRAEVEKMIQGDPKMKGIARYLASVEIFWSYAIPTACAGHGFIFFNPDFWASIPEQSRITVMAHEVWHLILKHLERGKFCDPADYNIAADHVINNLLEEEGFSFEGFEDAVKDPQYKGMSTEEVYDIVHAESKEDKGNGGQPPNYVPKSVIEDLVKAAANTIAGDTHYNNVPDQKQANKDVLDNLKESLGGATGYEHIKLEITDERVAVIGSTYEKIFADYLIDPISGARRSYMRPNRRQHGRTKDTFRLPGRVTRPKKSNRLAHLIYALDVSGSINKETAQTFHNSVRTIKELLNPNLLTVIFFDTEIKLTKTFTDKEPYGEINVQAGGCTCLKAVYAYAANRKPEAMVIFTDLAVQIPPEPKWHTIWLVPERHMTPNVPKIHGDIYIIPKT